MKVRWTPADPKSWALNLKILAVFAKDEAPLSSAFMAIPVCRGALRAWYGGHGRALLALLVLLLTDIYQQFIMEIRLVWLHKIRGLSMDEIEKRLFGKLPEDEA